MKNKSKSAMQVNIAIFIVLLFLSLSLAVLWLNGSNQNAISASAETASPFTFTKTSDTECSVRLADKTVTIAVVPSVCVIDGKEYVVTSVSSVYGYGKVEQASSVILSGQQSNYYSTGTIGGTYNK